MDDPIATPQEYVGQTKKKLKDNPEERANIISRMFFIYLYPLFARGRRIDIGESDLCVPISTEESKHATEEIEKAWNKESQRANPSFFRVAAKLYWIRGLVLGIILGFEFMLEVAQVASMGFLIRYFRFDSPMTREDAYWAAGGVLLSNITVVLVHGVNYYEMMKLGMRLKVAASGLLAKKAFSLSNSSLRLVSVGKVVNLLSTDMAKFDNAFFYLQFLWLWPLLFAAYSLVLYYSVGVCGLIGFASMFLLVPIDFLFSRAMGKFRLDVASKSDKRISVMNEILSGIRLIKMYGWEEAFTKMIRSLRRAEMNKMRWYAFCESMSMGLFWPAGKINVLCAALAFVLLEQDLTAEKIFVASALYDSARVPLMLLGSLAVQALFEVRVSCKRAQEFLEVRNEEDSSPKIGNTSSESDDASLLHNQEDNPEDETRWSDVILSKTDDPEVTLRDFTAGWEPEKGDDGIVLRNINLRARKGDLIMIVGTVGSGKSSLLASILKETLRMGGTLRVRGKPAYSAQDAWLFNGTILDNVLFGCEYDEDLFKKACELSCLEKDLSDIKQREHSVISDRGLNLSGGQRARVSLARTIYSQADIFLLDDPLSAVDPAVAKSIYNRCLNDYLKKKGLVIVTTHQLQFVDDASYIIALEDGKIAAEGKPEQMQDYFKVQKRTSRISTSSVELPSSSPIKGTDPMFERLISTESTVEELFDVLDDHPPHLQDIPKISIDEDDTEEQIQSGSLTWGVYFSYVVAVCGHPAFVAPVALFCVGVQLIFNYTDYLLNQWSVASENVVRIRDHPDLPHPMNMTLDEATEISGHYREMFTIVTGIVVLGSLLRALSVHGMQTFAAERLHNRMFNAVMSTNVAFFDKNPLGRILNRFSKDVYTMDGNLAWVVFDFSMGFLVILGFAGLIFTLNPLILLPCLPLLIIFGFLHSVYMKTSRNLRRMEATSRSPLYAHISSVMNGLITVRAFGRERFVEDLYHSFTNFNSASFQLTVAGTRWFALHLDYIMTTFLCAVTAACLFTPREYTTGEVALMLFYAVQISAYFSWVVRQSAELQNAMVSVERIQEYSKLPKEQPNSPEAVKTLFPSSGAIRFDRVFMKYDKNNEYALNNVTFSVRGGEKIGIVGRTGAGKSSIIRALFRLTEPESGAILIDDIDTALLPLSQLRKAIAIIPQEPVLFLGTVRYNLDPFDEFTDEQIWSALEQVELKPAVQDLQGGLEARMQEGGTNFSVGQRQLVCLARALLRKATVLVLDEATANVDLNTDRMIHRTIKEGFQRCTVLTIAHRLHTIMDSDKIVVMDSGKVVENDTPITLLDNQKSIFHSMVMQTGEETYRVLYGMAKNKRRDDLLNIPETALHL